MVFLIWLKWTLVILWTDPFSCFYPSPPTHTYPYFFLPGLTQVKSEPLAHAIANEWLSQKDTIQLRNWLKFNLLVDFYF